MPRADFAAVVVGGGVVGVAIAAELSRTRANVLLLERHAALARETTSRNSGVLHAGFHHPPEWLKTTACVEGRARLVEFAQRHDVPMAACGKLVVAHDETEVSCLEALLARGRAAGVEGLALLTRAELARREPEVRGVAALWSPNSGVIDAHRVVDALAWLARERGATLLTGHALVGAEIDPAGVRLEVASADGTRSSCVAASVVNAAGLAADQVAALLGVDVDRAGWRQYAARGSYWSIAPRHRGRVGCLVYPVPPPSGEGLGVHLTLDLDGGLRLGPDVTWTRRDAPDALVVPADGGAAFARAARRFLPFVEEDDLAPAFAGLRPKLSGPGEPARDFVVERDGARPIVHLVGIESPGLTAALALARRVVAELDGGSPGTVHGSAQTSDRARGA